MINIKLGEAIIERDFLESRLEALQSRITRVNAEGGPASRLLTELQRTANKSRDLSIAIAWTEQQALVSGLPLAAYRIRCGMLTRLASILEPINSERADELSDAACVDTKLIQTALWLIDLQVPKTQPKEEQN